MKYSWSIDNVINTDGKPNGTLLIAVENLTPEDLLASYSSLLTTVAQFAPGARFQFSKADVVGGTGMTG